MGTQFSVKHACVHIRVKEARGSTTGSCVAICADLLLERQRAALCLLLELRQLLVQRLHAGDVVHFSGLQLKFHALLAFGLARDASIRDSLQRLLPGDTEKGDKKRGEKTRDAAL